MASRDTSAARRDPVRIFLDGVLLEAAPGQSVAAAMMAAGIRYFGQRPDGSARGAFCMMGSCQECVLLIDGGWVESCRVTVRDGLSASRLDTSGMRDENP